MKQPLALLGSLLVVAGCLGDGHRSPRPLASAPLNLPRVVVTDAHYGCGPADGPYVSGAVSGAANIDLIADVLDARRLSIGAVHFTGERFGLDVRGGGGVGTVVIRDTHGSVLASRTLALTHAPGAGLCG